MGRSGQSSLDWKREHDRRVEQPNQFRRRPQGLLHYSGSADNHVLYVHLLDAHFTGYGQGVSHVVVLLSLSFGLFAIQVLQETTKGFSNWFR